MSRLFDMQVECERKGFTVDTYSPGDGVTRYRFFELGPNGERPDYFSGDGDFTALGRKEALAYMHGRIGGVLWAWRKELDG